MARRPQRDRRQAARDTGSTQADTPSDGGRAFRRNCLLLAAAAIVAFASSVPGKFVWLDHAEIEQANYRVVDANDFRRVWHETIEQYQGKRSGVTVTREQGGYWRPIYALAISLDWAIWGDRAWCYHVENIAWHVAVVLLLYTFGNQVFGGTENGRRAVFWATLLFAVHPFGVHSVTWISGRKDTMCAAFGIAALVATGKALDATANNYARSRFVGWIAASAALVALAIGSKELGFMVPILAGVFFFPQFRLDTALTKHSWKDWAMAVGTLFAVAAVLAIYRVRVVGAGGLGAQYPADSFVLNLAASTNVWWNYVFSILLPHQFTLSDAWPIPQSLSLVDVASVVAAGVLAVAAIRGLFHKQPWALALTWFVIWMIPASGLVPLRHFRAERYLYPASWGILLAVLLPLIPALAQVFASHAKRATTIILCILAGWFLLTTMRENTYWWTDSSLFRRSVAQSPMHAEGRIELARLAIDEKNYREAAALAQQALEDLSNPGYAAYGVPFYAHQILGVSLIQLGRPAEAIEAYQKALQELPNSPSAYAGLAMARAAAGDFRAAKRDFVHSLELNPNDSSTRHNLTLVLIHLGDFAEAVPHIERLIVEQPENAGHRARLAWCQWTLGRRDAAMATLAKAESLAPNDPVVRQVTGMIRESETANEPRQ